MADLAAGAVLDGYVARQGLAPDGAPIATPAGDLLPVRHRGGAAMLKVALHEEERQGAGLMAW